MKTLWTPWRMERITAVQEQQSCPFEPPGTAPSAKDSLLLYRDASRLCLLNRFPYANGHLLVAPIRHVPDLADLNPSERADLMELVNSSTAILTQVLSPDGFNIGINIGPDAGAGVPEHLHVHIVPRWRGDHNFLTVLAEVRTIPEHIDTTFDRLLPHFRQLLVNPELNFI
jgi:ATP adenylyltransferase